MELSPSWEAANCEATQELSSILWNPKVHKNPTFGIKGTMNNELPISENSI
jgi:hypothetical protein